MILEETESAFPRLRITFQLHMARYKFYTVLYCIKSQYSHRDMTVFLQKLRYIK